MSCGTVVVSSNTTSLPEVVGDGGIMLDPADQEAWTDCILSVADERFPREGLVARGTRRAEAFSWDRSAQEHVQIYSRLAHGRCRTAGVDRNPAADHTSCAVQR
jgi:glycosyltransferase involved in cell wall biosynthesis